MSIIMDCALVTSAIMLAMSVHWAGFTAGALYERHGKCREYTLSVGFGFLTVVALIVMVGALVVLR